MFAELKQKTPQRKMKSIFSKENCCLSLKALLRTLIILIVVKNKKNLWQ